MSGDYEISRQEPLVYFPSQKPKETTEVWQADWYYPNVSRHYFFIIIIRFWKTVTKESDLPTSLYGGIAIEEIFSGVTEIRGTLQR